MSIDNTSQQKLRVDVLERLPVMTVLFDDSQITFSRFSDLTSTFRSMTPLLYVHQRITSFTLHVSRSRNPTSVNT